MQLIWYDPKLTSESDCFSWNRTIKNVLSGAIKYNSMDTCISYIKSSVSGKISLITSGHAASTILSKIHECEQLERVFLFCENRERHLSLLKNYSKIVDIFVTYDQLEASIQKYLRLIDKQSTRFVSYDQRKRIVTNVSEQMAEFLWFQLYHDVLLQLSHNQKAKQEMIEACRREFKNNPREMEHIDEFEKEYTADATIQWYTDEGFLYKLVNIALRTADIKQLHIFRFYIADLSLALAREHRKREECNNDKIDVVYRGVRLTLEELEHIQMCEGRLLSFNGYLSTSRSRQIALSFAEHQRKDTTSVPVLFEINCNTDDCQSSIFADISHFSKFQHEKEVLFDIGVVFHVQNIVKDKQLYIVRLNATDEGKELEQEYIDETKKELDMESISILLGILLIKQCHYEQAKIYFRQLLDNPAKENLVYIHNQLGLVYYHQACFYQAIEFFNKANLLIVQSNRNQWRQSMEILCNLTKVLIEQGQYDKALRSAKEAKELVEREIDSTPLHLASCLYHIATSYRYLDKLEKALDFYKETLDLRRLHLSESHLLITETKHGIALTYQMIDDVEQAYNLLMDALEQYQAVLPDDHPAIAHILHDIANCFYRKGFLDKSLQNYLGALQMKEKHYHFEHPSIASTMHDLSIVYAAKGQKEKALKMCLKALEIRERLLPFEHSDLLKSYIQTARRYEAIQDYQLAESYFQKASQMQEKYFPKDHRERAKTAQNLKRLQLVK